MIFDISYDWMIYDKVHDKTWLSFEVSYVYVDYYLGLEIKSIRKKVETTNISKPCDEVLLSDFIHFKFHFSRSASPVGRVILFWIRKTRKKK